MCGAFVNVDLAAVSSAELSLMDRVFVCVLVPSRAGWSDLFRVRYAAFVELVVYAGCSALFVMGLYMLREFWLLVVLRRLLGLLVV